MRLKTCFRNLLITGAVRSGCTARAQARAVQPPVRVVCFHDVSSRTSFQATIEALVQTGTIIPPQSFRDGVFTADTMNILLTFDDGYQSWVDIVLPVLDTMGLKGLFFLTSKGLDVARSEGEAQSFLQERLRLTGSHPFLDWEGANALIAAGHSIGGHTVSHVDVSTLSAGELQYEIEQNKHDLESRLNVPIKDFAYPFGTERHITEAARAAARAAGYSHTYSAIPDFCNLTSEGDIPRLLIDDTLSPRQVRQWVRGGYDCYYKLKKRLTRNVVS